MFSWRHVWWRAAGESPGCCQTHFEWKEWSRKSSCPAPAHWQESHGGHGHRDIWAQPRWECAASLQLSAKAHNQYLGTSICRPSGNRFLKCLQSLPVLNTAFQLDKGGGTGASTSSEQKSIKTEGAEENSEAAGSAPDSPSKQLPDHISFFSGNPSVEIIHGVMHLYKTKSVSTEFIFAEVLACPGYAFSEFLCSKMTSLTEDVRRSAMVCILTVPATMTSHDLMKLMAPFNDVMEHMKIIRDSTPNQYMVLIKFCRQVGFPLELT